ncbi:hypothetical protein L9F63_004254 [Diploptera punctata]|uniref:Uncharacterized protein n=1 Tax=Diploptera punctata TaxID=6984 RepID=A0AAD8E828_DIPPU|nr:hypothetical protein L9F63_004254 [Diploptera punctata]
MPLTQREAIQLGLLLLCVPAQYFLSGNIGSESRRSQAVLQLVNEVKHIRDSWFKLESWKARWLNFVSWLLKGILQPEEVVKTDNNAQESPAIEVLRYREKAKYFCLINCS